MPRVRKHGGRARVVAVAAVCAVTVSLGTAVAWATETSTQGASLQATSASVGPPQALTAVSSCAGKKVTATVDWNPSASSFVTGYTLTRPSPAPPPAAVNVPATTTSYVDSTVKPNTSYTYNVVATYGGWSSVVATASLKTAGKC